MAKIAGKNLVIQVSTDDNVYNTVGGLNDASMSIEGDNQDITVFGKNFINRLQGLKDVTYSLSGFFDIADTTGQIVIRSSLINNSALYIKFLPTGTQGWKQQVKVASFEVSDSVDGVAELSIEIEGHDSITAVT